MQNAREKVLSNQICKMPTLHVIFMCGEHLDSIATSEDAKNITTWKLFACQLFVQSCVNVITSPVERIRR